MSQKDFRALTGLDKCRMPDNPCPTSQARLQTIIKSFIFTTEAHPPLLYKDVRWVFYLYLELILSTNFK